jgi:receptor protein-tyrosine kinase
MELELGIVREPISGDPRQRLRVFGESGGTIGRSPDNYWVLPDPKCYLSAHHCEILFRNGEFWVRDTSRNGVFLNEAEKPIGFGRSARLNDGDELGLAIYTVRVRLREKSARPRSPAVTPAESVAAPQLPPPASQHVPADFKPEHVAIAAGRATASSGLPSSEQALVSATLALDELSTQSGNSVTAPVAVVDPAPLLEDTAEHENLAVETESVDRNTYEAAPESEFAALAVTQTLDRSEAATKVGRIIHIDRARLQADLRLPPPSMERLIANQFRHIKRPLMKNALGRGVEPVPSGHLVMVTSSLPGEGKTFSSINLAFSLAREKDLEVVLIDADVAKKDISSVFGLREEPGLLDALADDMVDVESLILPTDVKGLSILPAGSCTDEEGAAELLGSSRMEEVAARVGARHVHRIALFDAPPLLVTNESRVLATLVGQILLIVKSGSTPRIAVQEALELIDEDKVVGLVLNQSAANRMGGYYGYGYYGYGSYGSYGDKEASTERG